ncbi:betaine--homocysteine S-methyltransferase 1-like [Littorina saxatilis]|uniref:Hcy-binding domain-containing protein n=1 Tax=Littorina saxatilis TaxID=31220 RepID=A0AAN9BDY3_9CAEN
MSKQKDGLLERLNRGEDIIIAEGYVFEFERRGYLRAGAFVPEVVLEHPDLVKSLHEEFVHAGSDVVLAFQYYGHREKLRVIGREGDLEKLNETALRIARDVADKTGSLMAGNLCNSTIYQRDNPQSIKEAEQIFKEQVEWAVKGGADYIVAESFSELGEAMLALEAIKKYGKGLPAAVSFIPHEGKTTFDGVPFGEACRRLEEAGAAVVGLNCGRGPTIIMPIMKEIRKACKGPIMCVPVPYRCNDKYPIFQSFINDETGKRAFPEDLPAFTSSRTEIAQFAREAKALGIQYVGLCCGNASHYLRVLAEGYGRKPPASRFSPNMKDHFVFGDNENQKQYYSVDLKKTISNQ